MRLPFRLAAVLFLALFAVSARADRFLFAGFSTAQNSFTTGTFDIDTNTGRVIAIDVPLAIYNYDINVIPQFFVYGGPGFTITQFINAEMIAYPFLDVRIQDQVGDYFVFQFPVTTFVNYKGGSVCGFDIGCYNGIKNANSTGNPSAPIGQAALTLVTPEPSSIALLGTGLLGFAGTLRRSSPMLKNKVCLKV